MSPGGNPRPLMPSVGPGPLFAGPKQGEERDGSLAAGITITVVNRQWPQA